MVKLVQRKLQISCRRTATFISFILIILEPMAFCPSSSLQRQLQLENQNLLLWVLSLCLCGSCFEISLLVNKVRSPEQRQCHCLYSGPQCRRKDVVFALELEYWPQKYSRLRMYKHKKQSQNRQTCSNGLLIILDFFKGTRQGNIQIRLQLP